MTSTTNRHRPALAGPGAILALLLALTLTACGSSGAPDSDGAGGGRAPVVASLPATTAAASQHEPASSPADDSDTERPLVRNDASDEERARLAGIYTDCLVGAGLSPKMVVKGLGYAYPDRSMLTQHEIAVCGNKEPESTFQRAMRTDPTFADHVHADVECLNDHGIAAIVQKDGGVGLENGLPAGDRAHWLTDCENKAFASFYATLPTQ